MTRDEFIEKIDSILDHLEFSALNKYYTILNWGENDVSIGEWNKPETVRYFKDVKDLVDNFEINNRRLAEITEEIRIIDFN